MGGEIFVADRPVIDESSVDSDFPTRPATSGAESPEAQEQAGRPLPEHDIELAILGRGDFTMDEIMGRLRRLEVYKPVMHFGWTQYTVPEEQSRTLDLASFAKPVRGLEGSLKLYLSRYLHLVVDLQLDAPGTMASEPGNQAASYGDYRARNDFGGGSQPVHYRIQEDRIFRSGELRYFDHPKFGVLAKVTRAEEETQEMETGVESELLGYPAE